MCNAKTILLDFRVDNNPIPWKLTLMGTEQSTLFLCSLQDRLKNAGNKSKKVFVLYERLVRVTVVSPKEKERDKTK